MTVEQAKLAGPSLGVETVDLASTHRDYRVEALARGLRVLSLFTERRPTWRVSDLSAVSGIPLPTVYRVVMTLSSEGYLERLPSGSYRPGVKVLSLGTAALHSLDLIELATPRLQALSTATGEAVNLAVLIGDRVLYLVRLRNRDPLTVNIQVGSTLFAPHISVGKLLLAYLSEDELRARVTDQSIATDRGPTGTATLSLAELRSELTAIRRDGWAVRYGEPALGLCSVAAPVFDAAGQAIAGANVAVGTRDWSSQRIVRELRPLVVRTCDEISSLLGHRGDNR